MLQGGQLPAKGAQVPAHQLQPANGHLRLQADPSPFGIHGVTRLQPPRNVLNQLMLLGLRDLATGVAKISRVIQICCQVEKHRATTCCPLSQV